MSLCFWFSPSYSVCYSLFSFAYAPSLIVLSLRFIVVAAVAAATTDDKVTLVVIY